NSISNEIESNQPPANETIDTSIELLSNGIIDGIPLSLGDSASSILEIMGNPDAYDTWGGGHYFRYPDVVFFTAPTTSGDTINQIALIGEVPLLGITVGQDFTDVQDALGYEVIYFNEYYENWSIDYQIGNHLLT